MFGRLDVVRLLAGSPGCCGGFLALASPLLGIVLDGCSCAEAALAPAAATEPVDPDPEEPSASPVTDTCPAAELVAIWALARSSASLANLIDSAASAKARPASP